VNPQSAEMEIHRDFHDEFSQSLFSSSLPISANVRSFLLRHGVATDCKIKIDEYCIKPKNSLFVLGTLTENPGLTVSATPVRTLASSQRSPSSSLPFSFNLQMQTSGSATAFNGGVAAYGNSKPDRQLDAAQQAKITAALTKAGITNPTAWAAAGVDPAAPLTVHGPATGAAAAPAPALEQFDLHPAAVLMKGAHNPAFFISWRSQREIVKSLGWKSALMIWGGPVLTLLCVYSLMSQFGRL
jgi:hypothetical protein